MAPLNKILFMLAMWSVLLAGSHADEHKVAVCPEIPPGAIVLGRYCRQEVHAALESSPPLERKENASPVQVQARPAIPNTSASTPLSTSTSQVPDSNAGRLVHEVTTSKTSPPALEGPPALFIRQGERLMPSLKLWLANQSIELVWAAPASTQGRVRDVVMDDDFQASSQDLRAVLSEILEPFGFEAEIATNTGALQRITVRNARNGF